jgi:hypothetical protein
MGQIVKYQHHGATVSVDEDLKGKHRLHCLCFRCAAFKPGPPEQNCPIANTIYAICILADMVTPVYECPKFVEKS